MLLGREGKQVLVGPKCFTEVKDFKFYFERRGRLG